MFHLDSAPAAAVAGLVAAYAWHRRRTKKGFPRRKTDYVWAFIEGGVFYVMAVLLIEHFFFEKKYAEELAIGFGESQVNIAFASALVEAFWGLWDLWSGEALAPSPEV